MADPPTKKRAGLSEEEENKKKKKKKRNVEGIVPEGKGKEILIMEEEEVEKKQLREDKKEWESLKNEVIEEGKEERRKEMESKIMAGGKPESPCSLGDIGLFTGSYLHSLVMVEECRSSLINATKVISTLEVKAEAVQSGSTEHGVLEDRIDRLKRMKRAQKVRLKSLIATKETRKATAKLKMDQKDQKKIGSCRVKHFMDVLCFGLMKEWLGSTGGEEVIDPEGVKKEIVLASKNLTDRNMELITEMEKDFGLKVAQTKQLYATPPAASSSRRRRHPPSTA